MVRILTILILSLFVYFNNATKLISISPTEIEKSFSSKIEDHFLLLEAIPNNVTNNLMLYIGYIHEEHDRVLPGHSYRYCKNNQNLIVRDWIYQENFYYSCCSKVISCNNSKCLYECPIPPANIDPDPFRTFNYDINRIFIREVNSESKWIDTKINELIRWHLETSSPLGKQEYIPGVNCKQVLCTSMGTLHKYAMKRLQSDRTA